MALIRFTRLQDQGALRSNGAFAEINAVTVTKVVVVANNELLDGNGDEQESLGATFCNTLFGGTWKQTNYNGNIRKNYAGIGFTYDSTRDAFIPLSRMQAGR